MIIYNTKQCYLEYYKRKKEKRKPPKQKQDDVIVQNGRVWGQKARPANIVHLYLYKRLRGFLLKYGYMYVQIARYFERFSRNLNYVKVGARGWWAKHDSPNITINTSIKIFNAASKQQQRLFMLTCKNLLISSIFIQCSPISLDKCQVSFGIAPKCVFWSWNENMQHATSVSYSKVPHTVTP